MVLSVHQADDTLFSMELHVLVFIKYLENKKITNTMFNNKYLHPRDTFSTKYSFRADMTKAQSGILMDSQLAGLDRPGSLQGL